MSLRTRPRDRTATDPVAEDLHVRSYDRFERHDLAVEVRDEEGRSVFERRYRLAPGDVQSELRAVGAGEYTVVAVLDGRRRTVATCRIDDRPHTTAVVEVGNGAVSVTEGLY